ncbi:hypothetical protein FOL46_005296 [Perkinsus olseni]|uniref:Uncharacterized protein n=1 Tax=Perkinsus olseni TaxID=32597 RepID=A0A7J6MRY4_PEROL|nr:hypothetical protein FOL46_005296 [Perkinsus olseni]
MASRRVIKSFSDPLVAELLGLANESARRVESKLCVVSGRKLLHELAENYSFKEVVSDRPLPPMCPLRYESHHVVSDKILRRVANMRSYQHNMLGTIRMPQPLERPPDTAKLLLILDGIVDAGQLGTILRSAFALKWHSIWFMPRTNADPFDHKGIRASQAVLWNMPFTYGKLDRLERSGGRRSFLSNSRVDLRFIEESSLFPAVLDTKGALIGADSSIFTTRDDKGRETDNIERREGIALLIRGPHAGLATPPRSFIRLRLEDAGGRMNLAEADLGMVASVALHEIKNNYFQHVSASPSSSSNEPSMPFHVHRSSEDNLPVHVYYRNNRSQAFTQVKRIKGDIKVIKAELENICRTPARQLNDRALELRGDHKNIIRAWLAGNGL